jgi:bifunctional non-homologous end joining protein LigD
MVLETYRSKRDFTRTREPEGLASLPPGRRFVIQKHDARRMHYDFRLELDGVLKSWAVPKGPPEKPGDRRLAVHVEDHPIDYGDFEGTIPEGEYGAGTVLVWDQGLWEPEGDAAAQYAKGKLRFCLKGQRLHGCWTLVRMGGEAAGKDRSNWLLIRRGEGEADDPYAEPERSVLSGRTLEEIATGGAMRGEPLGQDGPPPERLEPQLARLVEHPPRGDDWLFEIKFDGYRILARREAETVRLLSRNGKDWTERFRPIADAVAALPFHDGWLDGEVAILRPDGTTSFQDLQKAISEGRRGELVYLAFDLLHLDGRDLRGLPLAERKAALQSLLGEADNRPSPVRFSDHLRGQGEAFYRQACGLGLEGVIAKRADCPYRAGRGDDWRKIKCLMRQELVVGGFTEPAGSRQDLGALLVGHRDGDGGLRYAGKVGTGLDDRTLKDLRRRLDGLLQDEAPFVDPPRGMKGVHWTRPALVAEVAFTGWTADGRLRHPSYQGLREDKDPAEVTLERAAPAAAAVAAVGLSNPDKVLYPDQGLTKRGLSDYYAAVAERMLPEVLDRPLMLMRCPQGRDGHCFFQKHAPDEIPAGLVGVDVSESGEQVERYLALAEAAGLAALVQLGVLEIHLWGARRDRLERPDRMVFDLDPAEGLDWKLVVAAAREVRALLEDELGLRTFLRTTGGKGLHLVVPLDRRQGWDEVKGFSRAVAERLAREAPDRYTATLSKRARKGRIFIDYLRNGRGSTAIASYSTRARPGATVATPIAWDELSPRLRPDRFTSETVPRRLARQDADPWEDIGSVRQSLTKKRKSVLGLE